MTPAERERLRLANSQVFIEDSPDGPFARIVRRDGIDYAGPLPDETLAALRAVAR